LALIWLWRVNQRWDLDFCVHVVKGDDIKFDLWKIVTVTAVHDDENPAQGRFQVVEFEGERQKPVAGMSVFEKSSITVERVSQPNHLKSKFEKQKYKANKTCCQQNWSMFEKSSFMRGKKRSISHLPRPNT
jgi:hypothetical protein